MNIPIKIKNMLNILVLCSVLFACKGDVEKESEEDNLLKLQVRERVNKSVFNKNVLWNPKNTAVIIVDMWNEHHCKAASRRVAELAPFMDEVVHSAREKGILIIHAPSDCMDFYKDTEQRKRALSAPYRPASVKFTWNEYNPDYEDPIPEKVAEAGCSCDTPEPCGPGYKAWSRQHEDIEITPFDIISDNGQEIFNVLSQYEIENVIIMGVHTNVCVLGRPFGIRQMVYLGKNVVLCRDLTDSYHRDPGNHFEGLAKITEHIEKYWCASLTSEQLTGQNPFSFKENLR
jgi:nicotinamidase-related amidase